MVTAAKKVKISPVDYGRLGAAFKHANRVLEHPRKMRKEYIQRFAGFEYSNKTQDRPRFQSPLNMIQLDVGIKARQLAPVSPRCMCTSWQTSLKPLANDLEIALNDLMDEIDLGETLFDWVQEAMYGLGVVKIGLDAGNGVYDEESEYVDGKPYVDVVGLNDFAFDPGCSKIQHNAQWVACRTRLSYDYVMNNRMYDPAVKKLILPDDPTEADQVESQFWGGDDLRSQDLYGKVVYVWYFWFPEENRVAAIATVRRGYEMELMKEPLWESKWTGPKNGPYHYLSFIEVAGNPMPVSPVSQISYLDEKMNVGLRKLLQMAVATKKVSGMIGSNPEEVQAIKDARHGEAVALSQAVEIQDLNMGGVDQMQTALWMQVKNWISYAAGNLDLQGGLTTMSDTLGQDRMLGASASKQIDDMQRRVMKGTKGVMQDLGYYLWSNPLLQQRITKSVPGTPLTFNRILTPEDLQGEWEDFDIDFQPYSAVNQTPASELQMWMQMLQSLILPNLPLLQQQGASLDLVKLIQHLGRRANLTDMQEFLIAVPKPSVDDLQTHVNPAANPNKPNGQYERVNTSKKSPEAKEGEQIQAMMSAASGGKA